MNINIGTALLAVLCIALLGASLRDLKHLWLIRRFKRWLKNTPEETIIEAHIRAGYVRTDSGDRKITTMRKGTSTLTITRDSAPNALASAAGEDRPLEAVVGRQRADG